MTFDVDAYLAHYGTPGMKWGQRKSKTPLLNQNPKGHEVVLTKRFKSGEVLTITKDPIPLLGKAIGKLSPKIAAAQQKNAFFTLRDKDGKKVGDASFAKTSKNTLYLDWIGVKAHARGKGYATATMQAVIKYAKKENIKKLTLEVPGKSPDALHIYERLGFKIVKQVTGDGDIWGGLTSMEIDITDIKHADDDLSEFSNELADFLYEIAPEYFGFERNEVAHMFDVDEFMAHSDVLDIPINSDELAHYGIPGMKWGQRMGKSGRRSIGGPNLSVAAGRKIVTAVKNRRAKKQAQITKTASSDHKNVSSLRKKKVHQMSNDELKAITQRMQLERSFKDVSAKEVSKGHKIATDILGKTGNQLVSAIITTGVNNAMKFATDAVKNKKNGTAMLF